MAAVIVAGMKKVNSIDKILLIVGVSIFGLLGAIHLLYTFLLPSYIPMIQM
jgi:hypothetical protein